MNHYDKQKSQSFVRFKVDQKEAGKISGSQFTLFDFVSNSFQFSFTNKQLSIKILEELKKQPKTFSELASVLEAKKSTLYLLCLMLERAGLVESEGRGSPLRLSKGFSSTLNSYASWWQQWVET